MKIGHDDDAIGIEDLRRFGHEVHAGKEDDVGRGFFRLLGKLQRISKEIRKILNVPLLVVVREQNGVSLSLEPHNLGFEVEIRVDARAFRVRHRVAAY